MDENGDGKISKEEMLNDIIKELVAVAEASFKKLDTNNDGELDEAEI